MKTNWGTGIDMTPCTRRTTVIALIIFMALPAWGQQYLLYTPQPVTPGQKPSSQDGILVQKIVIQKGDTLYALSRKFSGRGMYYPQILLFNSIKNPNLIYTGNTLKIPVSQNEAHGSEQTGNKSTEAPHQPKPSGDKKTSLKAESQPPVRQSTGSSPTSTPSTELSLSDLKAVGTGKSSASRKKRKAAVHAKKNRSHESPAETSPLSPLPAAHKSAAAAATAADADSGQKLLEAAIKAYRQDDCRTALELLDRYLADNSGSPLAADASLYKADCYLKLSAQ
jgi:LysM repeat protein